MAGVRTEVPLSSLKDQEVSRYLEANLGRIVEVFAPRHLILFGSRAEGEARWDSDIDLIVVSEVFGGVPFLERGRWFNEAVPWPLRVDVWCLTVEEFERLRRQVGVVADACRGGLWVLRGELLPDEEVEGVMSIEEQAQRWVEQGEHDLNSARSAWEGGSYEWATAIAQQAAEKFLKALYIARYRATPPRTHNLQALATTLNAPSNLVTAGQLLTEDYFRARYPDVAGGVPHEIFDEATARERIAQAEGIREWVREQLGLA